ncbi:hypothetical protein L6V77_25275 [Myxococcota bacterium]|nr:hypothetical protein [Myxococcota bacterium]
METNDGNFENVVDSLGAIDELNDIADHLADFDDDMGDLGAQPGRKSNERLRRRLRAIQMRLRKGQANFIKRFGLHPNDLAGGKVVLPGIIYCGRELPSSLSDKTELKYFHMGEGDDCTQLGYTAAGSDNAITARISNLGRTGTIPENETFINFGFSHYLRSNKTTEAINTIPAYDVETLGASLHIFYQEKNGTVNLPIGPLFTLPRVYGLQQEFAHAATAPSDRNVHLSGPAYRFKRPLTVLRGRQGRQDRPVVIAQVRTMPVSTGITIAADTELFMLMHGIWIRHKARAGSVA